MPVLDGRQGIVGNAAADAHRNAPKNIGRIPGVFNGGAESCNGKRAHHAKGQGNVIADDVHDHGGDQGHHQQGHIESGTVYRAGVGKPVRPDRLQGR